MFRRIIEFISIGLALAKADPADKRQIEELQAQLKQQAEDLAALRADAPTAAEKHEISALLDEFSTVVTPKPAAETVKPPEPIEEEKTGSGGVEETRRQ